MVRLGLNLGILALACAVGSCAGSDGSDAGGDTVGPGDGDTSLGSDAAPDGALSSDLPEGSCRTSADCTGDGMVCLMPWDCSAPGLPPMECGGAGSCGEGETCHDYPAGCAGLWLESQCGPACAEGTDCGAGFVCREAACRAHRCDDGFTCLANQDCDAAYAFAERPHDYHGCTFKLCADDSACPQAHYCVEGYCLPGAGTCGPYPRDMP